MFIRFRGVSAPLIHPRTVVQVVKEVTSFWGLGQLMGAVRKITRAQAVQTSRKKAV